MKLPVQAAPVERISTTSSVSQDRSVEASSVEASRTLDDILAVTEALTPIALGAIGAGLI